MGNKFNNNMIRLGFPERHTVFRYDQSRCIGWVDRYHRLKAILDRGGIFLFLGKRGTGKTQMGTTLAGFFKNKIGKTVRFIKAYDVFQGIKDGFANNTATRFIDEISNCELLVIDGMEARRGTEFENIELNNILDKRYDNPNLITIITSNDTQESAKQFLGESVWSRIHQDGGAILFEGKNFREKIK